ncbi:hypothetical protein TYRP_001214 [Tyrophagus putrescentiae]|nr:hypothetical protein TYRP_001214 [Tyrophagus putrescentiae]
MELASLYIIGRRLPICSCLLPGIDDRLAVFELASSVDQLMRVQGMKERRFEVLPDVDALLLLPPPPPSSALAAPLGDSIGWNIAGGSFLGAPNTMGQVRGEGCSGCWRPVEDISWEGGDRGGFLGGSGGGGGEEEEEGTD